MAESKVTKNPDGSYTVTGPTGNSYRAYDKPLRAEQEGAVNEAQMMTPREAFIWQVKQAIKEAVEGAKRSRESYYKIKAESIAKEEREEGGQE